MKNLWLIIDNNPKIEVKEKMKGIKLMLYCYNMRFSLLNSEPLIKDFFNREEKVKSDKEAVIIREQKIARIHVEFIRDKHKLTSYVVHFSENNNDDDNRIF
jgi:hypothetical protein